ncbi:MAG: hypothetical protein KY476_00740, partial [Planctomycetes bacterium]|nr:hypothetical protein [Planctomycetota bacterium]
LFTLASALSLMLCAGSVVLWVRSHYRGDQVGWYVNRWDDGEGRFRAIGFDSDSGGIVFFLLRRESHLDLSDPADAAFRNDNPPLSHPTWIVHDNYGYPHMTDYSGTSSFGFGYFGGGSARTELPMVYHDHFVVVPGWLPSVLAAVLPATWIMRWRRRRSAHEPGPIACRACGDDVRATPQRCPVCGSVAEGGPAAA